MFLKTFLSVFLLLASPILSAQIADRSFRPLERERLGEETLFSHMTENMSNDIESQDQTQDNDDVKEQEEFDRNYIYVPAGILLLGVLIYTSSIPKYLFTIGKDPQAFEEKHADDRIKTGDNENLL